MSNSDTNNTPTVQVPPLIDTIESDADDSLRERYENYKARNDGSGDGFDPTSAIDGIARSASDLDPFQWAMLIDEKPELFTTLQHLVPGYSGYANYSPQDLMVFALISHLTDTLGSQYNYLKGEERDQAEVDGENGAGCYYGESICSGALWECETCHEKYCQTHDHSTSLGSQIECVACEFSRKEKENQR